MASWRRKQPLLGRLWMRRGERPGWAGRLVIAGPAANMEGGVQVTVVLLAAKVRSTIALHAIL